MSHVDPFSLDDGYIPKSLDREKNFTALIDLDGTIADLDKAIKAGLMELASPDELELYSRVGFPSRNAKHIKARRDLLMKVPGFWSSLEVIPNGLDVLNAIREVGFAPMILSKGPSTKFLAWAEKVGWVREHFPGIPVTLTENKALSYGRVLFDDYPPYFLPWLDARPRGLVICLATEDNDLIDSRFDAYRDRIVRYRGREDYEYLLVRLKEAYNR